MSFKSDYYARGNGIYEGVSDDERWVIMAKIEQQLQDFEEKEDTVGHIMFHVNPSVSSSLTEDEMVVKTEQEPHTTCSWYKSSSYEEEDIISHMVQMDDIDNHNYGSVDKVHIFPARKIQDSDSQSQTVESS
jgi:hypothetical protein